MLPGHSSHGLGLSFGRRIRPEDEGAFVRDWRAQVTKKPTQLRKGPPGFGSLLQATGKLGTLGAQGSQLGRMSGTDRVRERPWDLIEPCAQVGHWQHWTP